MPIRDPATLDTVTLIGGKTYEGTITYIGPDTVLLSIEMPRAQIAGVILGKRPDPEHDPF